MSFGMKDVSFAYPAHPILKNVSFSLPTRGAVSLSGASGCGKTTVLHLLAGLLTPQSGTVTAPQELSMVFQEDRLLPWLTVRQNVEAVLFDDAAAKAAACLDAVGLTDAADALPHTLSGGMKRRAAIARALAKGGKLLLLDEPFTGLDAAARAQCADAVRQRVSDAVILLVTHQADDAELLQATPLDSIFS